MAQTKKNVYNNKNKTKKKLSKTKCRTKKIQNVNKNVKKYSKMSGGARAKLSSELKKKIDQQIINNEKANKLIAEKERREAADAATKKNFNNFQSGVETAFEQYKNRPDIERLEAKPIDPLSPYNVPFAPNIETPVVAPDVAQVVAPVVEPAAKKSVVTKIKVAEAPVVAAPAAKNSVVTKIKVEQAKVVETPVVETPVVKEPVVEIPVVKNILKVGPPRPPLPSTKTKELPSIKTKELPSTEVIELQPIVTETPVNANNQPNVKIVIDSLGVFEDIKKFIDLLDWTKYIDTVYARKVSTDTLTKRYVYNRINNFNISTSEYTIKKNSINNEISNYKENKPFLIYIDDDNVINKKDNTIEYGKYENDLLDYKKTNEINFNDANQIPTDDINCIFIKMPKDNPQNSIIKPYFPKLQNFLDRYKTITSPKQILIVYDFDCTLSSKHVFSSFYGEKMKNDFETALNTNDPILIEEKLEYYFGPKESRDKQTEIFKYMKTLIKPKEETHQKSTEVTELPITEVPPIVSETPVNANTVEIPTKEQAAQSTEVTKLRPIVSEIPVNANTVETPTKSIEIPITEVPPIVSETPEEATTLATKLAKLQRDRTSTLTKEIQPPRDRTSTLTTLTTPRPAARRDKKTTLAELTREGTSTLTTPITEAIPAAIPATRPEQEVKRYCYI